jgi:urease accessory protein
MPDALLGLLRFADGLFPAGGYAYSTGLETCVQSGAIVDATGAENYLRDYLEMSAGPCDAVAAVNALAAARRDDLQAILNFDCVLDAMKSAIEVRVASRQMGRQTVRIAAATLDAPLVHRLECAADEDATPCHHAIVFGALGGVSGWTPDNCASAFLYAVAAQLVGAALRLIPIGQLEGQRILARAQSQIARLAGAAAGREFDQIWSFAPGIEIAAMQHAGLEARLFRS